jgi:hypothetical protein
MSEDPLLDSRTEEERLASLRYWQNRTGAERFAETWRLSVEHYGQPRGTLRDGPFRKCQRLPDGSIRILAETARTDHPRDEGIANDGD